MAERDVKVGLMTYTDADGNKNQIAFQGDTVQVAEEFVKRFDELNVQPGGDEPFNPERVANSMYGAVDPKDAEPASEEPKKAAPAKKAT